MPTGWFDSHSHLQERYVDAVDPVDPLRPIDPARPVDERSPAPEGSEEPSPSVVAAMARASEASVERIVCVGTDPISSAQAVALARWTRDEGTAIAGTPAVWATIGLHPHEASLGTAAIVDQLAAAIASNDPGLVAVGECGLDYHYDHSPRDVQRRVFAEQVQLARSHGLTLVIHARDAWDDLFDVLAAEGVPDRAVLHCFTGGPDEARRCLDAGMFVSFSGIVTFKNADGVRAAVALCPMDRLLVETDSPFLAPVPHRGRTNEPALVPLVGRAVAQVKGIDPVEIAESTTAAALSAFHLGG
jgi:TatD DNase family protein